MQLFTKSFFAAAFGTLIEYYDYALMSIFLPILSPLFFPGHSVYQSLVTGYWILLITLLMRPLGGISFGYLGDRFGRRRALLASMYGIAFATLAIGVMPIYSVWGVWTTIFIVLAKSVQMFCFGGEYNGAGIYVVEHAQNQNEGWFSAMLTATMLTGSLLASLLGVLFTLQFMPAWSWRIAFILGSLIGICGILYRKNLPESPVFKPADLKLQNFKTMIRKYPAELLAGIFIGGLATLPFTTVLTFINPVLTTKGYITNHQFMLIQTALLLIAIATVAISGKLADKKSPKKIMQWGCLILLVTAYPLLLLIDQGRWIFCAMTIFIMANEMFLAPANAYLKNLFAVEYRYRATSLSFCFGMSLIGGLTPIIENTLYQWTGHFQTTAIWLIAISLGTFLSLNWVERKQRPIAQQTLNITSQVHFFQKKNFYRR